MVSTLFGRFSKATLAQTTISLYELPMQYPSVRWQQQHPDPASQQAHEWLIRTVLVLLEDQLPLLTRELQQRVVGRLDEFVDYRITWDKFAQQAPPREEGGLLLAELDARITAGKPPTLRVNFHQHATARSAFSLLATLLDGFTTDTIRIMPAATQGWACLWLTYLLQWYLAAGPAALRGKISRHPAFYLPEGIPSETDFPTAS